MKCMVVSSNTSGGGKTTVTLGLLKALKNRGFKTQSYKAGPDYIDNAFHSHITGIPGRNLDLYLMDETGVKASFSRGEGDVGIIEGVMGLYDGKDITPRYSTAHLAEVLNLPIVLVLSPKAQVATLCAEINGLKSFGKVNIAGVILNNISEGYYRLLKLAIEKQCSIKVFGYLPHNENLNIKSRHLGLIQSSEIGDLDNKVELCANLLEKYVNIDELMEYFTEAMSFKDEFHINNMGLRTAVACDKAFSFYYRESIELLKEAGEVIFFSPLKDNKLPDNIDFIYLGGGYPEVFINELCNNKSMLHSIKIALESGTKCYAECGGLMYLTEEIEGKETVGFFKGKSFMTERLQNFGYASIEVTSKNSILSQGLKINCHEFHKSNVSINENKIYTLTKEAYDDSIKQWTCGFLKNNTLAAYGHVHFFGNMDMLNSLLR
ncbi:cobyrinate a,c-diamide synthase [Candidatus Clostridium radicumherbarum]|uniref:Cobyrinate a,c-diamide synthase n=1 Tax=Candidatus Clostridium radicumherbarum TaxID=3381662 RepID=A0ABW8TSY0_9CLOT